MCTVRGIPRRIPEWEYTVEHGDKKEFIYTIPVPSLPIFPYQENLLSIIETAQAQQFRGPLLLRSAQDDLWNKIRDLLKGRGAYDEENKKHWKALFARLPKEDDMHRPNEHPNVLAELIRDYGRKIHTTFTPVPADLDDYGTVDPIRFEGGPIEAKELMKFRRTLPEGAKGCVRRRKKKRVSKSSDSSGDEKKPAIKKLVSVNEESFEATQSEAATLRNAQQLEVEVSRALSLPWIKI